MSYKKIGVVVADKEEYLPLKNSAKEFSPKECKYFYRHGIEFTVNDTQVVCVYCGIGKVNAATATMHLIDSGCDCILNYGLSGGLGDSLRGKFFLPDRFLEHDFDMVGLGYAPCQKPDQDYYIYVADRYLVYKFGLELGEYYGGTAVSGDSFISDSKTSSRLYQMFGATTCDMETAAIGSVCAMAGVPFCSLRRVSDSADESATDIYREMNENHNAVLSDVFIKCLKSIFKEEQK